MPSRLERGKPIELEPGKILIIELINFDDWEKEWLERDTRAPRRGLILGAPPTTILTLLFSTFTRNILAQTSRTWGAWGLVFAAQRWTLSSILPDVLLYFHIIFFHLLLNCVYRWADEDGLRAGRDRWEAWKVLYHCNIL
jgi:hypothetical protein